MSANASRQLRFDFASELSIASRKMHTRFAAMVKERGLTLARARALRYLSRHAPVNQTELAAVLEIEGSTVVRLLDGLEEQGLVERKAVDGDRRAKQIFLTAAADAQLEELEAIVGVLHDAMFAGLDGGELRAAIEVLRRINRNIESPTHAGR
jgi:MarR family transcriptional regulator for hemolysin